MMDLHGKIFVVAVVCGVILLGIGLFLFWMERKVKKLERKLARLEAEKLSGQQ